MTTENSLDAFLNAQKQLKKACSLFEGCEKNQDKFAIISNPKRILEVSIPVKMDD